MDHGNSDADNFDMQNSPVYRRVLCLFGHCHTLRYFCKPKNYRTCGYRKMKEFKRYLITAALPYANGPVHIGHLAGCYIPADIYVRYLRAKNKDVKFVGGSDEHGVPITIRAMKENISPQEVVDKYHAIIKNSFEQMGISFDIYSRTLNTNSPQNCLGFFSKSL